METALQAEIDELFDPLDTASVFLHLMAQQVQRRGLALIVHSSFEGLKGARGNAADADVRSGVLFGRHRILA